MRRWPRVVTAFTLAGSVLTVVAPRSGGAAESPPAQSAAPPAGEEISQLRHDLEALRQEYGSRMAAIESRIAALEGTPAAPPAPPPPEPTSQPATAAVPPGAAGEGTPGALPVYGGGAAASKVFNPDIAAIGNFVGAAGQSPGGGEPSLNMQEAELAFQAVVDPYARADFFVTLAPDEVALEEGYITFPTLPGGFLTKVGKMRDAFGKVNGQHPHTLPFARPASRVDEPHSAARTASRTPGSRSPASSRTRGSSWRRPVRSTRATPRCSRPRREATSPTSATCAPTRTSASRPTSTSAARSRTATTASPTTPRRASSASTPRCGGSPCDARSTRTSSRAAR